MARPLGLEWRGQTETTTCRPKHATLGPDFSGGEEDKFVQGLSWRGGKEKLFVHSDRTALRENIGFGLAGRGVAATFCKVAFSLCKAALVAKKKAKCYRCDSC